MQNRPPNDLIVSLALGGLVAIAGLSVLLRYAGSLAALLTGHPLPTSGPSTGLGVLGQPGDPGAVIGAPGLNPVAYWLVVALALGALVMAGALVWRFLERGRDHVQVHNLPGTATRGEVARAASRPSLIQI